MTIRCCLLQLRGRDTVSTELFPQKQKEENGIKAAGTNPWAAQWQRIYGLVARMRVDGNLRVSSCPGAVRWTFSASVTDDISAGRVM